MSRIINMSLNEKDGHIISVNGLYLANDGAVKPFAVDSTNPNFDKVNGLVEQYKQTKSALNAASTKDVFTVGDNLTELANAVNSVQSELFDAILEATDLISVVHDKFVHVGAADGHITRKGNGIYYDLEPIDPVLEKEIVKALDSHDDATWEALDAFIKRLYGNSDANVRKQLYSWLQSTFEGSEKGFTLLKDGRFIGYKGCTIEHQDGEDIPVSINHGFAVADGVEYNGAIPNKKGSIVEMPRGMVQNDPSVGCSTGLHVGTYDYARMFSQGIILMVAVAPEDVVSVPTDCDAQKLRTCRYQVIDSISVPVNSVVYGWYDDSDDNYDDYDDEYCEDCDCDCPDCNCAYGRCPDCGCDNSYDD